MPVYEFTCMGCGAFEVERPMRESSVPASCPVCGGKARRVYTPPGVARLTAPLRRVLDEEERSTHEPDVVSTKSGRPLPHRHAPAPPWVLSH